MLAVSLTDEQIRNVVTLPGVSGVATLGSRVFAAANIAGGGRVVHVSSGAAQAIATGLLTTGHVTATPDGKRLLVAHPAADRASELILADGSVVTGVTETVPGTLVELHGLADGRLILLTTDALALVDNSLRPSQPTAAGPAERSALRRLVGQAPIRPLRLGAYRRRRIVRRDGRPECRHRLPR